jgi:hypothetical protein
VLDVLALLGELVAQADAVRLLAGDRVRRQHDPLRAAHADAPSIQVRNGASYELELRTTGEFTLRPLLNDAVQDSAGPAGL